MILTLHSDPIVCSGVVASLRRHTAFDARESVGDSADLNDPSISVVIADYQQAMLLTNSHRRAARGRLAEARILAFTTNDRLSDIRRAIAAGVDGYVLLGDPLEELIGSVTALAQGGRYLARSVAERIADTLTQPSLTSRELDVLRLVATGDCNKAVARQLRIEVGTVKTHMNAILGKLNAGSRTQAAAIAIARGLVEQQVLAASRTFALRRSAVGAMSQAA